MRNQRGSGLVYVSLILVIVGAIVYIGYTMVRSIQQTAEIREIRSAGLMELEN